MRIVHKLSAVQAQVLLELSKTLLYARKYVFIRLSTVFKDKCVG